MNYQGRRVELLRRIPRRPLLIHLRVRLRSPLELPIIEPEFLRRPPGGDSIEHAIMRNDALESVRMPKHPVRHVSAIAGAESALSVLVNKWISLLRVVQSLHQIFKGSAAPIAIDSVNKLLSVSRRAVEVDHDDQVSVGGKKFGIPAKAPIVSPRALWTPVDEELYGILLGGVEVWRLDQEALDFVAFCSFEPKGFER